MDRIRESVDDVEVHGLLLLSSLRFADIVINVLKENYDLEDTVQASINEASWHGLKLSLKKTIMFGQKDIGRTMKVDRIELEDVESFTHLRSRDTLIRHLTD